MKTLRKIVRFCLMMVNICCVLAMLFCAYSPYVNPVEHPTLSCCGLAFPITLCVNLLFVILWLVFCRKLVLLPVVGMLCCAQAVWTTCPMNLFQSEPPKERLKLLSYNVMGFNMDAPREKGEPNRVLAYLQKSDADIICMQEFITGVHLKKEEIDRALKDYKYRHHYRMGGGGNGLGCYSRYPILSATPVDYASRANGSIVYEIKVGEDTLTVINNHLESNQLTMDERATYQKMIEDPETEQVKKNSRMLIRKLKKTVPTRAAQADAIAGLIAKRGANRLVVCGDFNTSAISYAHRVISERLTDAFRQSGCGLGISYHENDFLFRIDHILVSPDLKTGHCTVDSSIKDSDHYPIWCYIYPRKAR